MKTLHFFFLLICVAGNCVGQSETVAFASADQKTLINTEVNTEVNRSNTTLATQHSKLAEQQLLQQISAQLTYPEQMIDYAFSGTVILVVSLTDDGQILTKGIHQSDLHQVFGEAVLATLAEFKSVDLSAKAYKGAKTLYIPVHFSL
jgi:outer membrane biosynthesis protein TonB